MAQQDEDGDFLRDVLRGLSRTPKAIPPKYFYDAEGSALFEAICATPEYYPTRTETVLLQAIAPELSARIPQGAVLVEFGSGASEKTQLILDAAPQIAVYVPMDISPAALGPAAKRIRDRYAHVEVLPLEGDFTRPMEFPPALRGRPTVGFFPGSTIGNFSAHEAVEFLKSAKSLLGSSALFIVGADMVKEPAILLRAYDDAQGLTAAFNLNLLRRMNRELQGDFQLDNFAHRPRWNEERSRVEMWLESLRPQSVTVSGHRFEFAAGEALHTENSHKFTLESFTALAESAGWGRRAHWIAPPPQFGIFLLSDELTPER